MHLVSRVVGQGTANATGTVVETTQEAFTGTRQFLEQFITPESRLLVSVGIVLVAAAVAWILLPRLIARIDRIVLDRVSSGRYGDTASFLAQYVPTTFGDIALRVAQFVAVVGSITAVLVVWGFSEFVTDGAAYATKQIPTVTRLTLSVLLFLSAYVGARIIADSVSNLSAQTEWMTEHQEEIVLRTSQLGLFIFAGMFLLSIWEVNLQGLLVGAGFLGIVVGLAARQTLGSLIAGFVLMFSHPFTIGDWVEVGDQEGIVTDITIFNTRLENLDGEFVIIPNDRVADRAIKNRSQKGVLRLRVDVGIDYGADPERAREIAVEAINDLDAVVDAPPPQVFPKSFGDSAVVLEMRFWIDHPTPPRKWRTISAVIQTVKDVYEAEDIKIPYPQRELSGRAEAGGFRVHDQRGTDGDSTDGSATDGQPPIRGEHADE